MVNFNVPKTLAGNGDIRIIGDRACGKTTYLAALAYWPNHNPEFSPIQAVEPFDRDTAELCDKAENLLKMGGKIGGTPNPENPEDQPLYTLLIDLKRKFTLFNNNNLRIQVSCREYGGELYDDLTKAITPKLKNYLDDCASASGLMIMIEGKGGERDANYAKALKTLREQLTMRLATDNQPAQNRRIAIVLTKAEQAPVWGDRKNIPDFMGRKLTKTSAELRLWQNQWRCPIKYFVCSAFGIIPGIGKPNVRGGHAGTIEDPDHWRPFGLIAPLYWLYTGKHDNRLNDVP